MASYVSLHTHSEYSLLDGLPKIKKLVSYAKEIGMDSLALTDHGVMYGAIEFYKECQAQEIKPIIGMEAYVVNRDHKLKETPEDRANNHLILLAKNLEGYKNLMQLTTIAHLEGYYYRPRFDKATLKKYSGGLICTSACPKGELAELIISGDPKKAKEVAGWYNDVFGQGSYFLEIQRHQAEDYVDKARAVDPKVANNLLEMQKNENLWVSQTIKISRELGIPLVATNDSHYLRQSDAIAQDALVCISTGKNVTDLERLRYVDVPTLHVRTNEEMDAIFPDIPEALTNTRKIAEMVDLKIDLGNWYFPNFEIPGGKTAPDYLTELAHDRFPGKYPDQRPEDLKRLDYELDVISTKGYAPYFLMMADMVNFCTSRGIITNTRGSAAGSVASYVLGITTVDAIKYAIPFERFLNPLRPKAPDIDLDIADDRREELLGYIVQKYGADKVAQICTFGRMLARAAIRDVGRVLGYPYAIPDKISKLVPLGSQGFPMSIKHALEITPELKTLYDTDSDTKKILDLAQELEGNARHSSVHAAGIVVSPAKMVEYTPLQFEPNGEKIISQYEMHACEDVGLVKFDILGIRNLSILGAAVDIIEKETGQRIDLEHIPLDDKKTFDMLASGGTMGTFQLGGSGMTKWLVELKPNRIEDIMVMIALFRPGPMANIPEFIARKQGKTPVTYLHPKMAKFLDKSYGVLVYQEDILFTALELAGYDWKSVDALRQAIGKKKPKEMAEQHIIFVEGCMKTSGMTKEEAEKLWDLFVPFQGYGFNKAHAASYGLVSYQTSYLKAHYPVEYMTALLTAESGDTDKIVEGVAECKRMGIVVLGPDINKSDVAFTIETNDKSLENKAIRFGLSAVKNIGTAAIDSILKARNLDGAFRSLPDFARRVDLQKVNKKALESLIKPGALDAFGKREAMLASLERIIAESHKKAKQVSSGQTGLFDDAISDSGEGKLLEGFELPVVPDLPQTELLMWEQEFLGFFLSEHPAGKKLRDIADEVSHSITDISVEIHAGKTVTIGAVILAIRKVYTKKNNDEMAFVTVQDASGGRIDCVVFPKLFSQNGNKDLWKVNEVVILTGRVDSRDEKISLVLESVRRP